MNLERLLGNIASNIDLIDRVEGVISTWRRADWKRAKRRGVTGTIRESVASLTGYNAPLMRVSHYNVTTSWSGIKIERLLKRHGIRIWDRGVSDDDLYFRVERRQQRWSEYILLRAGVPVSEVRDSRNIKWCEKFPPGDEPAKHRQSRRQNQRS